METEGLQHLDIAKLWTALGRNTNGLAVQLGGTGSKMLQISSAGILIIFLGLLKFPNKMRGTYIWLTMKVQQDTGAQLTQTNRGF
jgi:hypothetical protein